MEIVNQTAEPGGYQNPCKGTEEDQNSDLCAQWTAANGARDAARYTRWQLYAAAVGMLGLVVTIILTLGAVKAAQQSVAVAQDTAKRQLRAYVLPKDQAVVFFYANGNPEFRVSLHNHGQTPAYDVQCTTIVRCTDEDPDAFRLRFRDVPLVGALSQAVIGPGNFQVLPNRMAAPLSHEAWALIVRGEMALIFAGIMSYRDAFGHRRLSTFRYLLDPAGNIKDTAFDLKACAKGNKAN